MLSRTTLLRFSKLLVATSLDPNLNLAQLIDLHVTAPHDEKILFIWRSSPTITIGRHQNPYKECDLEYMKDHRVSLVRRLDGGGTGYQDPGQTRWVFMDPDRDDLRNFEILSYAMRNLGISASIRPRISRGENRVLLYGGFQFGEHAVSVSGCLRGSAPTAHLPIQIAHKNLSHAHFCEAIVRSFLELSENSEVRYLDANAMEAQPSVAKTFKKLKSYRWLFGKSSVGQNMIARNFAFGRFEVAFRFEGPRVRQALVHSDCQVPGIVEKFEDCINSVGRSRLPLTLSQRIYRPATASPQEWEMTQELVKWILPEIKKMDFIR
jgi:lipoate-protein ligase A